MAATATQTPPPPPPRLHLLNLYYCLHRPGQRVGRGHRFNFYVFSCVTGTEWVQKTNKLQAWLEW